MPVCMRSRGSTRQGDCVRGVCEGEGEEKGEGEGRGWEGGEEGYSEVEKAQEGYTHLEGGRGGRRAIVRWRR